MYIHQIWWDDPTQIPQSLQEYQETWRKQNPTLTHILWLPHMISELIVDRYPGHVQMFNRLSKKNKQIVAKYFILHCHGGIYADINSICTNTVLNLVFRQGQFIKTVILAENHPQRCFTRLSDHFLYSSEHHHFLVYILRHLLNKWNLWCFGSTFLTHMFWLYTKKYADEFDMITGLKVLRRDYVNAYDYRNKKYLINRNTCVIYLGKELYR